MDRIPGKRILFPPVLRQRLRPSKSPREEEERFPGMSWRLVGPSRLPRHILLPGVPSLIFRVTSSSS